MKSSRRLATLALCLAMGFALTARAGAPAPDTRQGDFAHVCRSGTNKDQPCTIATEDVDCPGSECVVKAVTKSVNGTLTIIAHDSVTDWANGGATNQALTVLLEVKAPDGSRQLLAATYQDLVTPTDPPTALNKVISIGIDEIAVRDLSSVSDLLFIQPEATLADQLRTLFGSTGTPAIVGVSDRKVQLADHTTDGLATVLRLKVKIQFLEPV
jgi:hypothetical protein